MAKTSESALIRNRLRRKYDDLWNEVQDNLESSTERTLILKQLSNLRERTIVELLGQFAPKLPKPNGSTIDEHSGVADVS